MPRNTTGIEVCSLMANRAAQCGEAKTIRPPSDGRLVWTPMLALARSIAGRMAVHAAGMREHLSQFSKICRRTLLFIGNRREAFRRLQAVGRSLSHRMSKHQHDEARQRCQNKKPKTGSRFHV